MLGDPVTCEIERDYPTVTTTITAYSNGYYLKDTVPLKLSQTRAGVDIPSWARAASNYQGEDSRTSEILSFENPTYHLMRLLWPINESTGAITNPAGYYGLYPGVIMPVPNWGLGSGAAVKLSASMVAGATSLYVSDLSHFPVPSDTSYVKIFSYTDADDDSTYDDGEETEDFEICRYTSRSGSSGAGYLTVVRTKSVTWNPSNGVVKYVKGSNYDGNHPSIEKKQYLWTGSDKISDVIDTYADDCSMIFFTKFAYDSAAGIWKEFVYWVPMYAIQEDMGNLLGLPTSVFVVTKDTPGLVGQPGLSATIGFDDYYNRVEVRAVRVKDGAWFYATAELPEVTSGEEVRQTLPYKTNNLLPDPAASTWTSTRTTSSNFGPVTDGGISWGTAAEDAYCQSLVQAKANEILACIQIKIPQYSATFKNTYFEIYQRVRFSGFANVPADVMRVTGIEYNYNDPGSGGMSCKITCSPADPLQASGKFQNIVDEIQANYQKIKDNDETYTTNKSGEVISTYQNNTLATVALRATGALIKSRNYGLRAAS